MSDSTLILYTEDPMKLFEEWLAAAQLAEPNDFEAMSLATATPDGKPSVRMVLLKGLEGDGFIFYTNKRSRKGMEIMTNAGAALCFHWKTIRRQIRVEGTLKEVSSELADAYFATRSRESCIAAWAADQSQPMDRREDLVERFKAESIRFQGKEVPRPPYWVGFQLIPVMIEFWLDQPHRLHDRACYTRHGKEWRHQRLYP